MWHNHTGLYCKRSCWDEKYRYYIIVQHSHREELKQHSMQEARQVHDLQLIFGDQSYPLTSGVTLDMSQTLQGSVPSCVKMGSCRIHPRCLFWRLNGIVHLKGLSHCQAECKPSLKSCCGCCCCCCHYVEWPPVCPSQHKDLHSSCHRVLLPSGWQSHRPQQFHCPPKFPYTPLQSTPSSTVSI